MSIQEVRLKSGTKLIIKPAVSTDAADIIDYLNMTAGESDNITFGPGEFGKTIEQEKAYLTSLQDSKNDILVVGVVEGEIICVANVSGGGRPRIEHNASFGITVAKKLWRQGIGKAVLTYLIDWAYETQIIRKINLSVRNDNAGAITLYKSFGFEKEGVMTREMLIDGVFIDTIEMGKKIDP
ncbi:MAG: GNAT family N-acetyltransferase [Candidatus Heimdallarchaeota archaeon]|nr:GNAT family N-acetyltransferase [Candidatus Heimdallarchaeota archaeon]